MANGNSEQIRVTLEQHDVIVFMRAGFGSNNIAKHLGVSHAAVLSRQNTLEKLGVISGGTMDGQRRQVLLAPEQLVVETEYRGVVRERAAQDRQAAAQRDIRLANLAKARAAKAAVKNGNGAVVTEPAPAETIEIGAGVAPVEIEQTADVAVAV